MSDMTYIEWVQYGYHQGWCTVPICAQHDGLPITQEEDDALVDDLDLCIFISRMGDDLPLEEIEDHTSAADWRKRDYGIGELL